MDLAIAPAPAAAPAAVAVAGVATLETAELPVFVGDVVGTTLENASWPSHRLLS